MEITSDHIHVINFLAQYNMMKNKQNNLYGGFGDIDTGDINTLNYIKTMLETYNIYDTITLDCEQKLPVDNINLSEVIEFNKSYYEVRGNDISNIIDIITYFNHCQLMLLHCENDHSKYFGVLCYKYLYKDTAHSKLTRRLIKTKIITQQVGLFGVDDIQSKFTNAYSEAKRFANIIMTKFKNKQEELNNFITHVVNHATNNINITTKINREQFNMAIIMSSLMKIIMTHFESSTFDNFSTFVIHSTTYTDLIKRARDVYLKYAKHDAEKNVKADKSFIGWCDNLQKILRTTWDLDRFNINIDHGGFDKICVLVWIIHKIFHTCPQTLQLIRFAPATLTSSEYVSYEFNNEARDVEGDFIDIKDPKSISVYCTVFPGIQVDDIVQFKCDIIPYCID